MKQPMRTRSRRCPPKIVGNTARTPTTLRSLGSLSLSGRPGATAPAGAPGVRNFPRARVAAGPAAGPGECHRSLAVARYLARRAAAERAARRAAELAAARKGKGKGKRPAWSGRPVQEAPELSHSPAATRPVAPPIRDAVGRAHDLPVWTAGRRGAALRREHERVQPARPRPSRVLAEIVAEVREAATT